jgi:hypothetical protein
MKMDIAKAYKFYSQGISPTYSTGICGLVTAGYGELDCYGYFEFPLKVNQETMKIIEEEN